MKTVNAATVSLRGPGSEAVKAKLVPAEDGMLVFVTPAQPLRPGAEYTISIDGVGGANGALVPPTEVRFTTTGSSSGEDTAQKGGATGLLTDPGRPASPPQPRSVCTCGPCLTPPDKAPSLDCGAQAGDPVDCATGLFIHNKTDLTLPGVMPLSLTRTYQSGNDKVWAFGRGATHEYDLFLFVPSTWEYADLILPSGARIHFAALSVWPDHSYAVYEHTASPTEYYKSAITYDYGCECWTLRLKDGTEYLFGGELLVLQSITDRNGNKITLSRAQKMPYWGYGMGNVVQISAPGGRWMQFSYDSSDRAVMVQDNMGRKVYYEYDAGGRLWKVTDAEGGVTEYGYDSAGRMLTIKDARGITYLTNEYDANGRVWRQTMVDNAVTTYSYTLNSKTGEVKQTDVTDPRLTVRRMAIGTSGWRTSDTLIVGRDQQQTIITRQADTNLLTRLEDALGRKTDYGHDECGNVNSVTRLAGTSGAVTTNLTYQPKPPGWSLCAGNGMYNRLTLITDPLGHPTTFGYDPQFKNLTSVQGPIQSIPATQFGYNTAGQVASVTDPLNKTWEFTYNSGDLATVKDPLQRTTTRVTDFAGRLGLITNPLGQSTHYEYDNLNRLKKVTDPLLGVTEFGYDPNGNLLSVKDARGGITSYAYENMDRLQTRTDPLLKPEGYLYDLNGNLTRFTDRKQQPANFTYDGFNRLTRADYADGSWTTYTYDLGNRLTQVVDSISGTITLTWDDLDRLTREVTPQGTVDYTYDADGRRATMTVGGQPTLTYLYDDADRLNQIKQGTSVLVTLVYDTADRRTKTTLPNGVSMEYEYDDAGQLTRISYKQGATLLGDLTYQYDAAGNRVGMGGSFTRTGLPQAVASGVYDAANRLVQWNGTTLTYDDNGNMTSDGSASYAWDARNRLASMGGGSFQYDGVGRRIGKTIGGVTTNYLYDGLNVVQQFGGQAATLLNGLGIDEVFSRTDAAGARHYLSDALGSTIGLLDASGAIQTQYTYEPYGKVTVSGAGSASPFQYTGRENDGTGVYYYRARYYHPGLQRFSSEDPPGLRVGPNLFSYANNNPLGLVDPLGQQAYPPPPPKVGGGPWKWYGNPQNKRDGVYRDPAGRSANWDQEWNHWDIDYNDFRTRYDRWGNVLPDGHTYDGPSQKPIDFTKRTKFKGKSKLRCSGALGILGIIQLIVEEWIEERERAECKKTCECGPWNCIY